MVAFLFWNLDGKPLQENIAKLASLYELDVIMLAECSIPPSMLLETINQSGEPEFHYAPGLCEEIRIFTRFPGDFINPRFEDHRTTVRHLKLPATTDILLVVTHLPSKIHWKESSQVAECTVLANMIRDVESEIGHSRTVLVGDFNANPFEAGVVNANGLHGVMSRRIAEGGERTVQGRKYPFFYNPMWGLLGDASPGPPGTYYYSRAEHTVFFWNMFDQVLIRPDLLPLFDNNDLEILQFDGATSFLSQGGIPDRRIASDHLPVFFRLSL